MSSTVGVLGSNFGGSRRQYDDTSQQPLPTRAGRLEAGARSRLTTHNSTMAERRLSWRPFRRLRRSIVQGISLGEISSEVNPKQLAPVSPVHFVEEHTKVDADPVVSPNTKKDTLKVSIKPEDPQSPVVDVQTDSSRGDVDQCDSPDPPGLVPASTESSPKQPSWIPGARVRIVGGSHRNKPGTFVKRTAKRITVRLRSGKETHLKPEFVVLDEEDDSTQSDDESPRNEPPETPPVVTFESGMTVCVLRGKYQGQRAVVVKRTPQRVALRLASGTTTYLAPDALELVVEANPPVGIDDGPEEATPRVRIETAAENPVRTTSPSNSIQSNGSSIVGKTVDVVKGTHKGKVGVVLRRTPFRIQLEFSDGTRSLLARGSVRAREDPTGRREDGMEGVVVAEDGDFQWARSPKTGRMERLSFGERPTTNTAVDNLAQFIYGDRVLFKDYAMKKDLDHVPEKVTKSGDQEYFLMSLRLIDNKDEGTRMWFGKKKNAKLRVCYLRADSPEAVQSELEKLAGFGRLTATKTVARLDLFLSTASKSNVDKTNRPFRLYDHLTASDFEEIPEIAHEGCGFIPRKYIEMFIGTHAVGKRTFALQVRIIVPKLGVFKGLLVEKPGIDKIQLPMSMKKVGPAEVECDDSAWLMINQAGTVPGTANTALAKYFADKSKRKPEIKFSPEDLFFAHGVSTDVLGKYELEAKLQSNPRFGHANLVGVSDPTGMIPSGHVFITGFLGVDCSAERLMVSRYPICKASDGRMLPFLSSKPRGMSREAWNFLAGLQFGAIIFGNPEPGCAPLPTLISQGDLDGDLYFVCWDQELLKGIVNDDENFQDVPPEPAKDKFAREWNDDWLKAARSQMLDIIGLRRRIALVKELYKLWDNASVESEEKDLFADAYKESIDIKKHGGLVYLPAALWGNVSPELHVYLSSQKE